MKWLDLVCRHMPIVMINNSPSARLKLKFNEKGIHCCWMQSVRLYQSDHIASNFDDRSLMRVVAFACAVRDRSECDHCIDGIAKTLQCLQTTPSTMCAEARQTSAP